MAVYVVTWNLNREGANYESKQRALLERLAQYDSIKDPGLESVVFIDAAAEPAPVREYLAGVLDGNDRLFLARLFANSYSGSMHRDVWSWIQARV